MSRSSQRLLAFFGSLFVMIAALETIPRFIDIPGLRAEELDPIRRLVRLARIEAHPYLAYVPKKNFSSPDGDSHQVSHNSLGFRGPNIEEQKPEGVYRILCLGGSSTYGHGPTSNATTWPGRLQTRLLEVMPERKIEVINGGCQGFTSYESLANYAFRGLALDPDLVIVYHAINDMRGALYDNVQSDNTHRRAVFPRYRQTWLDSSWTYMTLRAYLTDHREKSMDLGSWVITDYDERKNKDKFRWTTDKGFDNFERNLNSIVSLAKANGAQVMFGTQAMKVSTLMGKESKADQLRGFRHANDLVRKVAKRRQALLCDLGDKVTQMGLEREAKGLKPDLFTSEVHVTNLGADAIAREFAATIQRRDLLKR